MTPQAFKEAIQTLSNLIDDRVKLDIKIEILKEAIRDKNLYHCAQCREERISGSVPSGWISEDDLEGHYIDLIYCSPSCKAKADF